MGYFSDFFFHFFKYNFGDSWDIHGMQPIIFGYFFPTIVMEIRSFLFNDPLYMFTCDSFGCKISGFHLNNKTWLSGVRTWRSHYIYLRCIPRCIRIVCWRCIRWWCDSSCRLENTLSWTQIGDIWVHKNIILSCAGKIVRTRVKKKRYGQKPKYKKVIRK